MHEIFAPKTRPVKTIKSHSIICANAHFIWKMILCAGLNGLKVLETSFSRKESNQVPDCRHAPFFGAAAALNIPGQNPIKKESQQSKFSKGYHETRIQTHAQSSPPSHLPTQLF
ncbi:hypothetical protein M2103_000309 [Ereboglobus sp. PH5-5]|uniref:hypothetical protein n=1 Tax=Ereboglobus sp. PH5-5 TaxID=2940529 RepID=UPI0024062194|nr:hypothetical protein [Ereboglobus sp. PH5-5]MDF9832101.1 hypothetical protein [Ereboglobus sp. PH5-5]